VSLSAHGDWHTLETTSNIVYQLKVVTKSGKIASDRGRGGGIGRRSGLKIAIRID